jgi:hypothetical protein
MEDIEEEENPGFTMDRIIKMHQNNLKDVNRQAEEAEEQKKEGASDNDISYDTEQLGYDSN